MNTPPPARCTILYNALFHAGFALSVPYFLCKMAFMKKYRAGFAARFGIRPPAVRPGGVWFHAVSVGEATAAIPLIRRFMERHPGVPVCATATTDTGFATLSRAVGQTAAVAYYPLDFLFAARRFLDAVAPRLIVFMETELWPNMINEAARRGIALALANGRLSERSLRRYRLANRVFSACAAPGAQPLSPYLNAFAVLAMQTDADARRIESIGADASRVRVLGNIKYAAAFEPLPHPPESLRKALRINARPLLVCGSTHDGEEEIILAALAGMARRGKPAQCIIAPRHPHRAEAVAALARRMGFVCALRTSVGGPWDVLVVDTVGELRTLYTLADCVFVGKSLLPPGGGQNVIEPAAFGKPILCGPHTGNFTDSVAHLQAVSAIVAVHDSRSFETAIARLLSPDARAERETLGRAALAAVLPHKDVLNRYADCIDEVVAC